MWFRPLLGMISSISFLCGSVAFACPVCSSSEDPFEDILPYKRDEKYVLSFRDLVSGKVKEFGFSVASTFEFKSNGEHSCKVKPLMRKKSVQIDVECFGPRKEVISFSVDCSTKLQNEGQFTTKSGMAKVLVNVSCS
jgi:hypothetical protein